MARQQLERSRTAPVRRKEIVPWLMGWQFHRFVTLTFNDSRNLPSSYDRAAHVLKLREALRSWDARLNHALIGRYCATSPDRMFNFYFAEKLDTNPHWHGAVRFFSDDLDEVKRQSEIFDLNARRHWLKLIPSGTVDIQVISAQEHLMEYLVKAQWDMLNYDNLVLPDAFCRGAG